MRKHNGMRPQDVAILLKIIAMDREDFQLVQLAGSLFISLSEVSESLNRSRIAKLVDYDKKRVNRQNFFEFLEHGVRYVFPQVLGTMVRGIATAHSHPFMKDSFSGDINYVWPGGGNMMGLEITPFYPQQPQAAAIDDIFYKLLALVDVIRVGRAREITAAVTELKKNILYEPQG